MRLFSIILLLNLAIVHPSFADAAVGMLHADGIVTVQGADISETTITVVPANAPGYELEKGTKAFKLELPLNDTYLVIFAHPQCLTKQLFFDTRVPADYSLDHYTFPFEVVLEAQLTNDRSYVGPVGYIMYRDLVNDFDYETNYTLQIDEKLKERMNSVQIVATAPEVPAPAERGPASDPAPITTASATTASATPSNTPSSTARVVGVPSTQADPIATSASPGPIEREATPKALTAIEIEPQTSTEIAVVPVAAKIEEVPLSEPPLIEAEATTPIQGTTDQELIAEQIAPTPPAAEASGPAADDRRIETVVATSNSEKPASAEFRLPSKSDRTGHEFRSVDPMQFGRQEELIVEANKVTTIVRIVNEMGYYHEYRRVAHKFGPVFFFKDDQAIPAHMYTDLTGLPAN